jgi:hypothetical protein
MKYSRLRSYSNELCFAAALLPQDYCLLINAHRGHKSLLLLPPPLHERMKKKVFPRNRHELFSPLFPAIWPHHYLVSGF